MEKVTIIDSENAITGEISKFAILERDDGSFVSMPKSVWDAINVDSEGNK